MSTAAAKEAVRLMETVSPANNGRPDPITAAEGITETLNLASVGFSVTGARIVGRGGGASVDIYLSDGTALSFEHLRDVGKPNLLAIEVACCTGAEVKLNGAQALKVVALLRALAEHEASFDADEIARAWGLDYLQAAQTVDVNLSNQGERWAAFSKLATIDPLALRATGEAGSVAAASIVLRTHDGTRLVRTGWFRSHIRAEESISSTELANRMQRVGWNRRGDTGRIKATRPDFPDELVWTFYLVPADWEQGLETEGQVNG